MPAHRVPDDFAPNELTEAIRAAREAGRPILDLTATERTAVGLPPPSAEELAALADPRAGRYEPDPRGLLVAREAVAAYQTEREGHRRGGRPRPERIVLTAGTSEAYAHLFRLLCDAGDEVLIPSPSYPLFEPIARLEEVATRPYRLAYDGRWKIDSSSLRGGIGPRTRAVILVEPHNPTGSRTTAAERDDIVRTCAERGVALIVDEVFGDFAWRDGEILPSMAGEDAALTFALNGISKSCGLPQLKVGWIAVSGPARAASEAMSGLEWIADLFLTVASPAQWALPRLLGSRERFQTVARERIRSNLSLLREISEERGGFRVLDGDGGWTAVLRFRKDGMEDFALWALQDRGVHFHPGHYYDLPEDGDAVVSLLTPQETLREGVGRLIEEGRKP
jgi:aspartate/methionine/tyrosine aminotransferase